MLFDISFEERFYVMKHSIKLILYAKIKLINNFFISIRIFLNSETNVFYIDNVLIDKLNFKFVKSIDSINVQLTNEFHMSSDKQICCNFQMNTYWKHDNLHFRFFRFRHDIKIRIITNYQFRY